MVQGSLRLAVQETGGLTWPWVHYAVATEREY